MRIALVSCRDLPAWEVDDRPLVAALRARGAAVDVVPWDADVDWSGFDGALIRTAWDYWDRVDDFLAWTRRAAAATRLLHGPDVVAWNVDKAYLRELAGLGVPVAPTAWLAPLTGPGYFVAHEDPQRPEVWIDYTRVPGSHPESWPPLRGNESGLARFVYGFMVDTLRGVSEHVTIGSAARKGRDIGSWFVLCREP